MNPSRENLKGALIFTFFPSFLFTFLDSVWVKLSAAPSPSKLYISML